MVFKKGDRVALRGDFKPNRVPFLEVLLGKTLVVNRVSDCLDYINLSGYEYCGYLLVDRFLLVTSTEKSVEDFL